MKELLIPVGNKEMCLAAIHNGADAVYMGMPGFNARGRTVDFTLEALKELIDLCHLYGVKVYLAFNILIFEQELRSLEDYIKDVIRLNPDAFIIQDIGLARLIKAICPEQRIHGSTQMTVTSHEAIHLLNDLGFKRYTLSRELSIPEIHEIKKHTEEELEVFVHGALCVSYSGQCLTSESFGGRSANRGQCAQSCRLEYKMIVDGEERDLVDQKYLVSPSDLCAIDEIDNLKEIGVEAFKIEGRLKSPFYVAATASHYKRQIEDSPYQVSEEDFALTYSRGFTTGWLNGVDHQKLVNGVVNSNMGLMLGEIKSIEQRKITIGTHSKVFPGDGVSFASSSLQEVIGARVYTVDVVSKNAIAIGLDNKFSLDRLSVGDKVYLNDSVETNKKWQRSFQDETQLKKNKVRLRVSVKADKPIRIEVEGLNEKFELESDFSAETARTVSLTEDKVQSELSALSKSAFQIQHIHVDVDDGLYVSAKSFRLLRKKLIEEMEDKQLFRKPKQFKDTSNIWAFPGSDSTKQPSDSVSLNLLIRDETRVDCLEGLELDTVYLDFDYGRSYKKAVQKLRDMGFQAGIASLRVNKSDEYYSLKTIEKINPDAILIRNLKALHYFKDCDVKLVGDYSLNICNSLSKEWLMNQGLERCTPSHDLNKDQLMDLMKYNRCSDFEVIIHQYMPSFYMEHCVFAAFLSDGSSYKDCGKPCDIYQVELKDHKGKLHPVKPDQECRNTMFNGTPQSAGRLIPSLMEQGVANFRIETLNESEDVLRNKVQTYSDLIQNRITLEDAFIRLQVEEKFGISEGQLMNNAVFQNRKKEENPFF